MKAWLIVRMQLGVIVFVCVQHGPSEDEARERFFERHLINKEEEKKKYQSLEVRVEQF